MGVDGACETEGIPIAQQIAVGDLTRCMDAGIGAACTLHDMIAGLQVREGGLNGGLDGRLATGLALPAMEWPAVIVDFQGITRHMQALAYGCAPCNAKALAKGRGARHAGAKGRGVMRWTMLILCLLASPVRAQDDNTLPPMDDTADTVDPSLIAQDAEFVKTISTVLQDAKAQKVAVDLALTRLKAPDALRAVMAEHFTAILGDVVLRTDIATTLTIAFATMGMTPSNPDVIARLAGEQLVSWGEQWGLEGLARLPAADQAAGLALRLRLAAAAPPQDCADYLSDMQEPAAARRMQIQVMMTWAAADVRGALALMRKAVVTELSATEAAPALTFAQMSQVEQAAGVAIMAAIDATDDPARLYAAFGYPEQATAEDICAVRLTMLQAVQAMTGPEAAMALRYVSAYGLNG